MGLVYTGDGRFVEEEKLSSAEFPERPFNIYVYAEFVAPEKIEYGFYATEGDYAAPVIESVTMSELDLRDPVDDRDVQKMEYLAGQTINYMFSEPDWKYFLRELLKKLTQHLE